MATFTEAVTAMTEGKAIRRAGWHPCTTQDPHLPNFAIRHYRNAKGEVEQYRMEWLVSDMSANDWEILDSIEVR